MDDRYRASNRGAFCEVFNQDGNRFGFSAQRPNVVAGEGMLSGRVPLGDPSILKVGEYYYVTGTSDELWTANFPLYRSRDLVTWEYAGLVFPPETRDPSLPFTMVYGPHQYCSLWAPEFFRDPLRPELITLAFTAVRNACLGFRPPRRADNASDEAVLHPNDLVTSFYTTVLESDFLQGAHFLPPQPFAYRSPTTGLATTDGGWLNYASTGLWSTIPTTLLMEMFDWSQPGRLSLSGAGNRPCFNSLGCNVAMGIDGTFHVDPDGRPWLMFNWHDWSGSSGWGGNHLAAFPMIRGDHLEQAWWMDASAPYTSLVPLASRVNNNNAIRLNRRTTVLNGNMGPNGSMGTGTSGFGVAEGPMSFFRSGQMYFGLSRNHWESAAYGIFVRRAAVGSLGQMSLGDWRNASAAEEAVVVSSDRARGCGESFGHGSFFWGPQNRPYLIFQQKDAALRGCGTDRVEYPRNGARTVYIKELTFDSRGRISTLSNSGRGATGVRSFLIPRPAM